MREWTPNAVKAALVDAFEVDFITGGRVGPKMFGSAMPDYFQTETDIFVIERVDLYENDGAHFKKMQSQRRGEMMRQRQATSIQITRMETVLLGRKDARGVDRPNWIGGFLKGQDGPRHCLEAHSVHSAFWNLKGRTFDAKRFCNKIGWNYRTYRSRRDRAAEIIASKLVGLRVEAWL